MSLNTLKPTFYKIGTIAKNIPLLSPKKLCNGKICLSVSLFVCLFVRFKTSQKDMEIY